MASKVQTNKELYHRDQLGFGLYFQVYILALYKMTMYFGFVSLLEVVHIIKCSPCPDYKVYDSDEASTKARHLFKS